MNDRTTGPSSEPPSASRLARIRAQKAHLAARVATATSALENTRRRSRAVDATLGALEHDVEIGGGVLDAAVGFRVFLFLVPYVFVFVAGFGVASGTSNDATDDAARRLGIGGLIAHTLRDFGNVSFGQRVLALAIGVFALALAARALVKTLAIVHALIWRSVNRRKVSSTKGALLLVALVTVAMAASATASWLRGRSLVAGLLGIVLYMTVPLAAWLLASYLLPHAPGATWRAMLPGAIVVALGVELLSLITLYWISGEVSRRSETYGSLGAALAMLLWAYLLGRLVVTATVMNASLWRRNLARRAAAGE